MSAERGDNAYKPEVVADVICPSGGLCAGVQRECDGPVDKMVDKVFLFGGNSGVVERLLPVEKRFCGRAALRASAGSDPA